MHKRTRFPNKESNKKKAKLSSHKVDKGKKVKCISQGNIKKKVMGSIKREKVPGEKALAGKRERFCQEYLVDMNIRTAGTRAGYKMLNNSTYLYELMKEPVICNRISYLQWSRSKRLEISQNRVLQEIAAIAFFNIKDLYNSEGVLKEIASLTREEAAAVTGVDVVEKKASNGIKYGELKKIHHDGKQAALMNLGKHLGMFQDKSGFIDPMLYELRDQKTKLENLPEEDLIALSRIMRKAAGSSSNDEQPSSGVGVGDSSVGEKAKILH